MNVNEMPNRLERDLNKLLIEWKLDSLLPHLIAEKVDVNILEMMKIAHIRLLLHDFPVGIQICFEYNLEQWRRDIGKPLQFHIQYDERNPIIIKEPKEKSKGYSSEARNEVVQSNENVTDSLKNSSYERTTLDVIPFAPTQNSQPIETKVNLTEILLQCPPDGSEIIEGYHEHKIFSQPERKHLINTIINYYLENDKEFNLQTSYDLENAILEKFPSERLDMYRKTKLGILFKRYIALKSLYNKHKKSDDKIDETQDSSDKDCESGGPDHEHEASSNINFSDNDEGQRARNLLKPIDSLMEDKESLPTEALSGDTVNGDDMSSMAEKDTEILLQTLYNGRKKFVKICNPYSYHDFLSAACAIFKIHNKCDHYVLVNDCEISANEFKNVILQYYKKTTFAVELKQKANHISQTHLTKVEHCENSCFPPNTFAQSSVFSINTSVDNSSVQIIYNHLPDANDIRNIPALFPVVKMSDDGKNLENKHRTAIAKAIIDECLNFQPERVLKRQDFFTMTDNIIRAFPKEVASAYYIPSQTNQHARGKLWNAYNNKRAVFGNSGIVQRRHHNIKRKHLSDQDDESEKTMDKVFVTENLSENVEFSLSSDLDWNTLPQKWSKCHRQRRNELIRQKLSPRDYMEKYSILKSDRGIDLMEIDVNILYPTVANINNWLSLYDKVLEAARKVRKVEMVPKLIDAIDNSNDEKYRASLALLLISFIFPYNSRRNEVNGERASKSEIQDRFIKEYESMGDLNSDESCAELQVRFVHQTQKILYAEFNVGGFIFKCSDLLEALSSIFHYIIAMNMEYPKMCMHIWQFIQLAVFQIEIQDYKLPNVESTINDLYMN